MTDIDQFESVFNAAAKPVFHGRDIDIREVLVVTDLDAERSAAFADKVRAFLRSLSPSTTFNVLCASDYADAQDLLEKVDNSASDLVCSYRNLKSDSYQWPYSLGVYLNVLTRMVPPAVMILPHPALDERQAWAEINTDRVLVVTDHLAGDEHLVSYGARFTEEGGTLYLAHVEDADVFERYMDVIGKIPDIPTDEARELIRARLLKEPADYIESCRAGLEHAGRHLKVVPVVQMGHTVEDYRKIALDNQADLVVFRTRDSDNRDRLALQGQSYGLALSLRDIPILTL